MTTQVNIKSSGTTYVSPTSGAASSRLSGIAPSPSVTTGSDDHRRSFKRWFIGPMPEKVVATEVKRQKLDWRRRLGRPHPHRPEVPLPDSASDTSSDSSSGETDGDDPDDSGPPVDRERLKDYFINRGGKEEDWEGNRDVQRSIQKEIKRKWKESGWYGAWKGDKRVRKAGEDRKWVGKSFIIGDVLGTGENLIHGAPSLAMGPSSRTSATSVDRPLRSSMKTGTSGVGIPTPGLEDATPTDSSQHFMVDGDQFTTANPNTSTTALTHTSAFLSRPIPAARPLSEVIATSPVTLDRAFTTGSDGHDPLAPASGLRSALKSVSDRKGKRKSVIFGDSPAPPMEVLARSGPSVLGTSAELKPKTVERTDSPDPFVNPKDIIMQDRMLVKVSYNRSEGLPHPYDEAEASRHPDTVEEDWAEFMVCWRSRHLELYEDWSLPGKKYLVSGKKLAFKVPLRKPNSRISLYSAVDASFCITCPPTPVTSVKSAPAATSASSKRTILHRAASGTNIFVFNLKSRSRAIDWMWHIWRHLGGEIPGFLEIRSPDLGSRVRIDIPDYDSEYGEGYKALTRHHILDICRETLSSLHLWDELIAPELKRGRSLELCWRKGPNLEWIWVDTDIDNQPRDWAVVYFAGFRQLTKGVTQLEVRLVEHATTQVLLSDGTKLSEPPAIEGYLYRIKPNTKNRALMYVSSHGGNLFTTSVVHSYPPPPPAPPGTVAETNMEGKDPIVLELRRGAQQILNCEGYVDMRSISSIRRAVGPMFPKSVDVSNNQGNIPGVNDATVDQDHEIMDDENETPSDAEDVGGEEVMNTSPNKMKLKLKTTFELVLRNGHVVRFEAHSATIALEWIAKLRALVSYWTRRHRVDARQEMDLMHAVKGRPRMGSPEILPDAITDFPYIGEFWNWCILEGCRPMVKAGRLFEKRGLRKHYKQKYHVLTHGHLVQFHLTTNKSAHHHRSRSINLVDSYVYSGQLAVATLPRGAEGTNPTEAIPKRYQDGLEAEDSDQDVTFIIWYRPHSAKIAVTEDGVELGHDLRKPHLGDKHKVLICKARSKLERDAWCFALNSEIERLTKSMPERERSLRDDRRIS